MKQKKTTKMKHDRISNQQKKKKHCLKNVKYKMRRKCCKKGKIQRRTDTHTHIY